MPDMSAYADRAAGARLRIAGILGEEAVPEPLRDWFLAAGAFLLSVKPGTGCPDSSFGDTGYEDTGYETAGYEDTGCGVIPERYGTSYANPAYASAALGADFGPVFSAVSAELRGIIPAVRAGDAEGEAVLLELYLELYFAYTDPETPGAGTAKHLFASWLWDYTGRFIEKGLDAQLSFRDRPGESPADLARRLYLYRCGEYGDTLGAALNPRFKRDHSEDLALVFRDAYASMYLRCLKEALEARRPAFSARGADGAAERGGALFLFSEEEALPPDECAICFSTEQRTGFRSMRRSAEEIARRYYT